MNRPLPKMSKAMDTNRYTVSETLAGGIPCIVEDGTTILCVFPQLPDPIALDRAQQVCNILNGLEGLPS